MRIIEPSVEIMTPIDGKEILKTIERAGRVCYKSENKITEDSAEKFVAGIIKRGHEAVLEHYNITVKFICDRGVSHEIVRHRMASYCQESSRYCNYSGAKFGGQITCIDLATGFQYDTDSGKDWAKYEIWREAMDNAERYYFAMLDAGATAQEARSVLPSSLKTEVVMTSNLREWRHFLKLRTAPAAHPQMQEVAKMLLRKFKAAVPVIFDDIAE